MQVRSWGKGRNRKIRGLLGGWLGGIGAEDK